MKSDNVDRDPSAPSLAVSQLVRVREYYDEPVLWVCSVDRYSELSRMRIRCPICNELMARGEKA